MQEYPGEQCHVRDQPNVLVVAHLVGEHLFGSERSFLDMLDGLAHLPANIYVALPRDVAAYTRAVRDKAEHVFVFEYGWWRKDKAASEVVRETFKRIIAGNAIDVVTSNTIMLRESLQAAKECEVQSVIHVREIITQDDQLLDLIGQPAAEIIKEIHARADWIVGNSQIAVDIFRKPERTFLIPNTVEPELADLSNSLSPGRIRFGLISSNIPKKGIFDLVGLATLAEAVYPQAEFLLIGPESATIREIRKSQSAGLVPHNLVLAGYDSSPKEALTQVHVVVNFSHFAESFGRTVLEAMAARRPVIAYNWGALPELVVNGSTGYLIRHRTPSDALEYVGNFCSRPELINEFGERGRARALNGYGIDHYRAAFRNAYLAILEQAFALKPRLPLLGKP